MNRSAAVRPGHGGAVCLPVDGQLTGPEMSESELTRPAGQLDGLLQELGERVGSSRACLFAVLVHRRSLLEERR